MRLESDLSRVRAEADEKVKDLEKRLEAALGELCFAYQGGANRSKQEGNFLSDLRPMNLLNVVN